MNVEMIIMGAATLLSGIHGNNGSHTVDAIKGAVATAIKVAQEAEAALAAVQPPKP